MDLWFSGVNHIAEWASYQVKSRVVHVPGMLGSFSPPPRVSDPDMHHGTCVTHVPRCMPGSLTSGFFWSQWRGKSSWHSQCMGNPQFYVSGKRPMQREKSAMHYSDVIMRTIASLITSLAVVYSTVYSYADQRKHQSSASLAFVWGIHRDRWIPRTKGQLRGKCFHLMTSSWEE